MNEPDFHLVQLSDGRQISYSDEGTGERGTWLHCHGIPGSRYEMSHLNDKFLKAGLRVIVPDRPGYGASTWCPKYNFAQHSSDLQQLADHLGLTSFAVSGFSGGGVFALAASHDLGSRIESLSIAATPAPPLIPNPEKFASELTASTWLAALHDKEALARDLEALTNSANVLSTAMMEAAGDQEAEYLSSSAVFANFLRSLETTLSQGPRNAAAALARDSFLTASSWPFQPEAINTPVNIVHGSEDRLVFPDHAVALANSLGKSAPTIIGGGHFKVLNALWF